ncbi:MAG: CvpA family protein [Acetobacteraceae bacterium]|nr:CvpA family protein [Acetobacteraceae bacterium]
MNWVDLVVLGVILISGLLAFARGLVREALGLGAWAIAAYVASPLGVFPLVQPWARMQVRDTALADTLAFVGVFVIVLILLSLLAGAIASAVRGSALGSLDRTLGLVFGLLRGAALVCVAYILAGLAVPMNQWPAPVLDARSLPFVYRGAAWASDQMPPGFRPVVAVPPGRVTNSAELLHANPVGRALGARPTRD